MCNRGLVLVLDELALYRDRGLFRCCHEPSGFPLRSDSRVEKPQPIDHQLVGLFCQVSLIEVWGKSLAMGSKLSTVTCQANKMSRYNKSQGRVANAIGGVTSDSTLPSTAQTYGSQGVTRKLQTAAILLL